MKRSLRVKNVNVASIARVVKTIGGELGCLQHYRQDIGEPKSLDVSTELQEDLAMANHGLLHIALLTRDLKKTEQFYTKVLGLKVAFRVPPNMVFLRSPASQDLINFVGTKKRIAANAALQHFGFKTTKAGLTSLEKQLKENEIEVEGRRGKHAIYFADPNGYTIEYYCD